MQKLSLEARVREHLERARASSTDRSAETVYGGHEHVLRQTILALCAGNAKGGDAPAHAAASVVSDD